jgi:tetratricopeptide (TPR) repeat protein
MNRALIAQKRDNSKEMIKYSQEAHKINSESDMALYRLSQGYKMKKDYEKSKECIVKAIKLKPSNVSYRKSFEEIKALKLEKDKSYFDSYKGFYLNDKEKNLSEQETKQRVLQEKVFRRMNTNTSTDD